MNQKELKDMDRRTRKMMHAYGAVHPRADVDRLYVQREDGGRSLMSILDTVRYEEQGMIEYNYNQRQRSNGHCKIVYWETD